MDVKVLRSSGSLEEPIVRVVVARLDPGLQELNISLPKSYGERLPPAGI